MGAITHMPESTAGGVLPKLAIVTTHPIQYQTPLWATLAHQGLINVQVFYASDHGIKAHLDPQFGKTFSWDIPLLNGYDYEFLPSVKIMGLPGPVANRWPIGLRRQLKQGGFDAILLHGYMTAAALAGYWHARRLRMPILLRGESHLHQKRGLATRSLKRILLPRFLRNVNYCLAIGQWNREYWQHYGVPEERIRTTLYSVDNERFRQVSHENQERCKALRSEWGAQSGDTIFAYAGKLQSHKGLDTLLEAYRRLRSSRSDVRLVLIGDGPQGRELQERGRNIPGIICTGFINQSELPVFFGAVDALVLPSKIEPWGLVVNEAMACGTPVIVSDAVGCGPDLVEHAETGLVFSAENISALVGALDKACDPEIRKHWIQNIPAVLQCASHDDNARTITECVLKLSRQGSQ